MRSLTLALALLLYGAPLASQTVHGRIYDPATGAPISTAFVILLDDAGNRVAATLSKADGQFVARAPVAGTYRLRVERIGYETVTSPELELTAEQPLAYSIPVSSQAIKLTGVVVEAERRCTVRPEQGLRIKTLWDEARKALRVAAWTEEQGGVPFVAEEYERARALNSLNIEEEVRRQTRFGYGKSTFASASAEELAENGYVQRLPDNVHQYFGLDAETLLSDAFLDSHCFRIEEPGEPSERGLIGLAFEPAGDSDLPDVEGTLWLDDSTAELSHLEFNYTKHLQPMEIPTSHFGGRVEFRRLDNGAWIVDRWWIRMPQVVTKQLADQFLRMAGRNFNLRILEAGGEVLSIAAPATAPTVGTSGLSGVVYDSTQAAPLEGAAILLPGTPYASVSDASGRFAVMGLPSGDYEVIFFHPRMDSLRIVVPEIKVSLAPGEIRPIDLVVPDVARCEPTATDATMGTVVGFVRGALTGEPVEGAEITMGRDEEAERVAESDATGRYLICGVPPGEPFQINASHPDYGGTAAIVTLQDGGIFQRDLALSPRATIVAGTIDERVEPEERKYPSLPVTGPVTQPTVQGRLLDQTSEDPISGATVTLLDLEGELVAGTLTDADGAFVIPADHVGRYQLRAERIGYLNVTSPAFDLLADELLNVQLRASMNAIPLAPLTVTVDRAPLVNSIRLESRNFYERQEIWGADGSGFGQFVNEAEIEKQNPLYVTDVLRSLNGVHVQGGGGRQLGLVMRGGCTPTIYLDGAIIRTLDPAIPLGTSLNRLVSPQSLVGIEVYPGSTKPAEFMEMGEAGLKACGSIVLWTG